MPATYAHYRFGQEVFVKLPPALQNRIAEHIDLFHIGLHGPDILFYYRPLWSNPVKERGHALHRQSGLSFFLNAAGVLKEHGDPAHLVYIYGVLCHFALDRSCHGYINQAVKDTGITHSEIEREFDRRLLVLDGYDPLSKSLTDHLHGTDSAAAVIADFYPGITKAQIKEAVRSFVFYSRLLLAPGKVKRGIIEGLLKLTGNYEEVHGMIINKTPNPACKESNMEIGRRYLKARGDALSLIREFPDCTGGKEPWSGLYRYNFSSVYMGGANR